MVMPYR